MTISVITKDSDTVAASADQDRIEGTKIVRTLMAFLAANKWEKGNRGWTKPDKSVTFDLGKNRDTGIDVIVHLPGNYFHKASSRRYQVDSLRAAIAVLVAVKVLPGVVDFHHGTN